MKAVPLALIKPAIGATDGLSKLILGIKNQLDQPARKFDDGKYGNKRATH